MEFFKPVLPQAYKKPSHSKGGLEIINKSRQTDVTISRSGYKSSFFKEAKVRLAV